MFSIIACVGKNLELGKNGDLCFHIPEDLKYFKKVTEGHPVIMGSSTYKSLPKAPLPKRKNIVLTRSEGTRDYPEEVVVLHSIEEVLGLVGAPEGLDGDSNGKKDEIFVIGGGSVYRQFLPLASKLYLTEVKQGCDGADTFFEEFDKSKFDREVVSSGKTGEIEYDFVVYTRKEEL
ncbi:dihydrofolate reductase [Candidatus Saccharibacteria bacterium]|nr:dihydrofolate reductase [Candidatus Saccharibacteria bacterium]